MSSSTTVECAECRRLLNLCRMATYTYGEAVGRMRGAVQSDAILIIEKVIVLHSECVATNAAFLTHIKTSHTPKL